MHLRRLVEEIFYIEFSDDGELRRTSSGVDEWLDESRRSALKEAVRTLADEENNRTSCRVDGRAIRITEMAGDSGEAYLATVRAGTGKDSDLTGELTPRQTEVAEYAANGATTKEIAKALEISRNTVKHHLKNIYDRLGIGSRVELARMVGANADGA